MAGDQYCNNIMVFKIYPYKYVIARFIIYGLQHLHPTTPASIRGGERIHVLASPQMSL